MRLLLVLIWSCLLCGEGLAQNKATSHGAVTFDGGNPSFTVWRDTVSNPHNSWQIGPPRKPVFSAAHSPQNAILTDTAQPYRSLDTSSFYIAQTAGIGWEHGFEVELRGWYSVDADSLVDYGTIELSPNGGRTWIDLLRDSAFNVFRDSPAGYVPVLTGRSDGWKPFQMDFGRIADSFRVRRNDTILLRVTFTTDSIQTNRDGLMFDDLMFVDYYEGIDASRSRTPALAFPNPAGTTVRFRSLNANPDVWRIALFTASGHRVKTLTTARTGQPEVFVGDLPPGTYFYTLRGLQTAQTASGTVVIDR